MVHKSHLLTFSSLFWLCLKLTSALDLSTNSGRQPWSRPTSNGGQEINLGLIVPHSIYNEREYNKAVSKSLAEMQKLKRKKFPEFVDKFTFGPMQIHRIMMKVNPSPTEILNNLCEKFLRKNVTTILYLTNSELFGRSTASSQYFLQLASYLGIPVIAWNADNSGLERRSQARLQLQLAPSLEHQVAAMLSILARYNWQQFSIVTSEIAGHDDFVQAVRDRVAYMKSQEIFSFRIQVEVKVSSEEDLRELELSETRIILMYSTKLEGGNIMKWASKAGLTGRSYVWIATQSVIGESNEALPDLPAGMLGVSFDTSLHHLISQISTAMMVFVHGAESFIKDESNIPESLVPNLSCDSASDQQGEQETRWTLGETFHKYLRNVSVAQGDGKPDITFSSDGTLESVELKIMNLRPDGRGANQDMVWEEIGVWQSYQPDNNGLDIKDIVWPGQSHVPPQGVPEKFHLTVGFLEEPPFVNLAPPDPVSGKCNVDRGVPCKVPKAAAVEATNSAAAGGAEVITSSSTMNANSSKGDIMCCSGFCIDLLAKFADDLQFEYDLIRVEDPKWGVIKNGKWNGLMGELVAKKFDMVLTSLKVNAEREAAVDFTSPFLESGTTVLVAKRTGIISPTAFLEPFDAASWLLVGFAAVQISAFSIFVFEWLSPSGYDMKASTTSPGHRFSLFRTYWLVWALLFQAPVNMDCPRAFTARFMASVWALFAVVFLAIYTASLASFMITREEWDNFKGIDDPRLANPNTLKPPLRFGTVPWTYTEEVIRKKFPDMYLHMKQFSKANVLEGISAVKRGELDAFIYDATVLEYLVAQDEECKLLTVGAWAAMTGYGAGFPRNSKHFTNFNRKIMDYSENGDLERLRRFWLTGTCNPKKEEKKASEPLAPEQFLSAFFLLMCGIFLAIGLMGLEHAYIKWMRGRAVKMDKAAACCGLISKSMGKSLTFGDTVIEAAEKLKNHRCPDPICDTNLWKVKHELDMAKLKMKSLEDELITKGIDPETILKSNDSEIEEDLDEDELEDQEEANLKKQSSCSGNNLNSPGDAHRGNFLRWLVDKLRLYIYPQAAVATPTVLVAASKSRKEKQSPPKQHAHKFVFKTETQVVSSSALETRRLLPASSSRGHIAQRAMDGDLVIRRASPVTNTTYSVHHKPTSITSHHRPRIIANNYPHHHGERGGHHTVCTPSSVTSAEVAEIETVL